MPRSPWSHAVNSTAPSSDELAAPATSATKSAHHGHCPATVQTSVGAGHPDSARRRRVRPSMGLRRPGPPARDATQQSLSPELAGPDDLVPLALDEVVCKRRAFLTYVGGAALAWMVARPIALSDELSASPA